MNGLGRDLLEIASLLVGLSLMGLLVTRSGNASQLIGAASGGFGYLLKTATFQGNGGQSDSFGSPFFMQSWNG